MDVSETDKAHSQNLSQKEGARIWNWHGENPAEVVLVAFILIFFFMLPRTGCGIDKTEGQLTYQPASQAAAPAADKP